MILIQEILDLLQLITDEEAKKELENLSEEHSDHPMVIEYKNKISNELKL